MEIRLLGPVSLAVGGNEVPVRSPKQRVILAMLALSPRVTVEAIADALWRDTVPASVASTVHTLVSRLRRAIADAGGTITIRSEGFGYVMAVDPDRVDIHRFETAVATGRQHLAAGATAEGVRSLRDALSLWRGPALEDVADHDFARAEAVRLDEARLRVAEELVEVLLEWGGAADAIEVLEPVIARYPFHERLRAQEMVALYRLGRQADALAAFRHLRRSLQEELGLDPTPALVTLERQILLQAPELDCAPPHDLRGLAVSPGGPPAVRAHPEPSFGAFVGRIGELAELTALLSGARLVTISGVGGVGKTRLALEVATRCGPAFADGTAVVELGEVGDDRPLAGAVLAAMGLDAGGPSAAAADQRLDEALGDRHLLLVLDNCEHLLPSVRDLAGRLVRHCPGVTILATSREALSIPEETAWLAPGLSLPPEDVADPSGLEGSDAAALFVARACVAQPGFGVTPSNATAVASICRRLDGLPLALELAAARVRVLGAAQVAAHLDDRFRLLTGGATATGRHQTLAACLDWSYETLAPAEQSVLRRLAIFPQRFDLEAATAVAGDGRDALDVLDLLARLVDKSLVVPDGAADTTRYRLLETVRQYAVRRLADAGEEPETAERHRQFFAGLVQEHFESGETFTATAWLLRESADRENFHRALVNALTVSDGESLSVLLAGLWMPWYVTGSAPPAVSSIDPEILGCINPSLHMEALIGFNIVPKMATSHRSLDDLETLFDRAVDIADRHGRIRDQGWARCMLGYVARSRGDVAGARALMAESLARFEAESFAFGLGYVHYELGWVEMTAGDGGAAGRHLRYALAFNEATPGYEILTPAILAGLALADAAEGDGALALERSRAAVESARGLPFPSVLAMALVRAAEAGAVAGTPARAELAEALHLLRRQGGRHWVAAALTVAALFHEAEGRTALAARLLGGAAAVARDLGEDPEPIPVVGALVVAARERLAGALGSGLAEQEKVGHHMAPAGLLRAAAEGLWT